MDWRARYANFSRSTTPRAPESAKADFSTPVQLLTQDRGNPKPAPASAAFHLIAQTLSWSMARRAPSQIPAIRAAAASP